MRKMNILCPIGCRSDEGLSKPVIRRLEEADWCNCLTYNLVPGTYGNNYQFIEDLLQRGYKKEYKPDLVFCTADRIEMTAAACAAFHNRVKIAHFYAGVIDYSFVLLDDKNRHVITLYADIAFCEDYGACFVVGKLWESIGRIEIPTFSSPKNLEKHNIYNVGISHLDDLEIDESLVPKEKYDLIVYNPPILNKELIEGDITEIHNLLLPNKRIIWIEPNPDLKWNEYPPNFYTIPKISSRSRSTFLGLLKNCDRYITNSSNVNYEARPLGLKKEQIIQVGLRNKERTTPKNLEVGASDKIVKILKKWWCEQNKDNM